eukprot:jgi/Picsp_1/3762/NSC_06597-R1_cobyrinic acid -diamide synthase
MDHSNLPPTLVIAGGASGVGKSVFSVGLMSTLRVKGLVVQAFKVGPDFIDPLYHSRATGRPSINLDGWFSTQAGLLQTVQGFSEGADVCVIEGTSGLNDDLKCTGDHDEDLHESSPFTTAQVAKLLGAPVILVVDGSVVENSIGALVRGYYTWDPELDICGIIFNKLNRVTDVDVLSSIVSQACGVDLPTLGGMPRGEASFATNLEGGYDVSLMDDIIVKFESLVSRHVDVERILENARERRRVVSQPREFIRDSAIVSQVPGAQGGKQMSKKSNRKSRKKKKNLVTASGKPRDQDFNTPSIDAASADSEDTMLTNPVRIAVAKDMAFCYYYEQNFEIMKELGVEIVHFSPLAEGLPPNISGVYLGGGVPELYANVIADNKIFRAGLKNFVDAGGVVFAEGGGLLVLCQSLQTRTGYPQQPMVGIFPFRAIMTPAKVAKGYAEVSVEKGCPLFAPGSKIRGYINHSSELVQEQHIAGIPSTSQWSSSYQVTLKQCQPGCLFPNPIITDGFTSSRVIASYVHHHFARSKKSLEQIVEKCKQVDISAVSSAVASSRRMADFLEGSIIYTPPPTPVGRRPGSIVAVQSSPELGRRQSRAQSIDFNDKHEAAGIPQFYDIGGSKLPKASSFGSLTRGKLGGCGDSANEFHSGHPSPTQLAPGPDRGTSNTLKGLGRVNAGALFEPDWRATSNNRLVYRRPSNNSDTYTNNVDQINMQPTDHGHVRPSLSRMPYHVQDLPLLRKGTYNREDFLGSQSTGSIAVCNSGVQDILFTIMDSTSKIVDVSKSGLGNFVGDISFGAYQHKSVQSLQGSHSRRCSSDMTSDTNDADIQPERQSFRAWTKREKKQDLYDIDFEVMAQIQPEFLILEAPSRGMAAGITDSLNLSGIANESKEHFLAHIVDKLSKLSLKTPCQVIMIDPYGLSDVLDEILRIGAAVAAHDQAAVVVRKLRKRLRKVVMYSEKARDSMQVQQKTRILILSSLNPLVLECGWANDMIDLLGGEAFPCQGEKRKCISWEDVIKFEPTVLVISASIVNSGDKSAKIFSELCDIAMQPGWWQLPAVKDGTVVVCEEALLSRIGPRLIDGAEALARIVYGDNVPTCCPPRSAFKLRLRPGQRCRPRLLPSFFMAYC